MHDGSDLMTTRQFAAAFSVDEDTVRLWCHNGAVPGAFQTPGGHWRIPRAAVEAVRKAGEPAGAQSAA